MLFIALIIPNIASGNDYATDTSLWLKHDKITCWSLSNLEEHKGKSVFVFDYSREVGKTLGKPWTVVELGKCYQIDSDYNQMFGEGENASLVYIFKQPISSEFQSILINTIDTEANIDDFIQVCSVGWRKNCDNNPPVVKLTLSINDTGHSLGVSADAKRNQYGISFTNLPTRFFPTYHYTGWGSVLEENEEKLLNDPRSSQLTGMMKAFLTDLDILLNDCDTRIRVEEKGIIESKNDLSDCSESSDTIWRLESGKDFWIDYKVSMLERIQLMGCSDEYHAFLKEKKDAIAEFDQLMEILSNEYATYSIEERDPDELKTLTDFAEAETVPVIEITAKEVSYKTAPIEETMDDFPQDEILPDNVSIDISLLNSKTIPVIKTETENHQDDTLKFFYLLYFAILPIFGMGGLIIWRIAQKNKKPSVFDNKNT